MEARKTKTAQSIVKIEKTGVKQTYDIEVDSKDHLFLANGGIVTSNSHAISYAHTSYQTAYAKAHFPVEFYLAHLNSAKDKAKTQLEIGRLHEDMKKNGVYLEVPDVRSKNSEFVYENGVIKYGLSFIKSVGDKGYEQIEETLPENINDLSFTEILFRFLVKIRKSSAKVLIASGAMDFVRIPREKMLYTHEQCLNLSKKEVQYIVDSCKLDKLSPIQCVSQLFAQPSGRGLVFANSRRKSTVEGILNALQFPPYELSDDIKSLATREESFLGSSISCSKFDLLPQKGMKCVNFEDSERHSHQITAQVKRINDLTDKNGNEMAFLVIGDDSGVVENAIMFSGPWDEHKDKIRVMGIYEFRGVKDKEKDSFNINSLKEVFV